MYALWYDIGLIDEVQYQILKDEAEEAYNDCMHDAMVRWAECIIGCAHVVVNQQTQHGLK